MKKFLGLLAKGRWGQENIYNLYDASISVKINNQINEKSIFKYYQFDSDSYDSVELDNDILVNSKMEIKSDSREFPGSLTGSYSITTTVDSQSKTNLQLTKNNLVTDCLLPEMGERAKSHQSEKNKSKKNLYLIEISNSKNFHIGSQKTININKEPITNEPLQGCEVQPVVKNYSNQLKNAFRNCEKVLTEKYISLISKYMNDQWKEFFMCLGLEKTDLQKIELRYNNDRILCTYDALHRYLMLFPNTSLGFIICILFEIQQVIVVEKLMQEIDA